MYTVGCYFSYLAISIVLTVWVASTLSRNGGPFLLEVFHGDAKLAASVNHLLIMGFYLINIGNIVVTLRIYGPIVTFQQALEQEGPKLGTILIILGTIHFFNIFLLATMRRKFSTSTALGS
jgi:hypothetical protein